MDDVCFCSERFHFSSDGTAGNPVRNKSDDSRLHSPMKKIQSLRLLPFVATCLLSGALCCAQFAHARFGIKFYSMDTDKTVYELNAQQLFVPGSTTKLLTEGTALELLGGDTRFHTRIYRTGPIRKDGTLDGDVILVASGDYDLSNRIQPDGTLTFEDEDHSYGGPDSKGLPGDTLLVGREFAQQIADKGVKRVKGRVLVDATLFPEGDRELGTGVVISPMVVNDNVIDVIATPGPTEGAPVSLKISPKTAYVSFVNQATTGRAGSKTSLDYSDEKLNPDG